MDKKEKGAKKDFSIKINAREYVPSNSNVKQKKPVRIGKVHFELTDYLGQVNANVSLNLVESLYKNSTISFNISICDPEELEK